jgi:hypothetical protein
MKSSMMSSFIAAGFIAALAATSALAQGGYGGEAPSRPANGQSDQGGQMEGGRMQRNMPNLMGMHKMPAKVTSIDKQTGIVKVNAEGMDLTVHFPPESLANVKQGDTITLHLAFSK